MAETAQLIVEAVDKASGTLKAIEQELKATGAAATAASQATSRGMAAMVQGVEKARGAWDKWLIATGAAGAMMLVREAISAVTGALNQLAEGDRLNRIEQGFRGVALAAGQASSDMMRSLKEATDLQMEETDLQLLATRFRDAGLAGANMGRMLEWAWDKARERGEDLGALTQKMLVAASTGETRSLGVYGMVVDSVGLLKSAAKDAGVPVEQLTEAERRLLIQTSMLAQITGEHASVAEGLGSAYARAKASLGDFGSTVRQTLAGALPGETASAFRDAFAGGDLLQTWERMPAAIEQARAEMDRMTGYMQAIGSLSDGVNADLSEYGDLLGKDVRGMAESTRAEWLLALQELHRGYGVLATDAAEVSSNAAQLPPALAAAQGVAVAMADRTRDAAEAMDKILALEASSETSILSEEQRKQGASLVVTLREQAKAYQEMDAATRYTTAHVADLEAQIERLGRTPGAAKQRAELEALVKAAKDAQKPMYDVMRALEGTVAPAGSIGLARQILGESGTPEELVAIAAATQDVAGAAKAMQDAIAKGDPTVAAERMQALTAAIDAAERSMATVRDRSPAMGQAVTQAMQEMRDRAADLQLAMQATGMSAEVAFARMRDAAVAAGNAIMTGPLGGYIRVGQALVAAVGTAKPANQPKPVRGGGGAAKPTDITQSEADLRMRLAAETDELTRAELEYAFAVERLTQKQSGQLEKMAALAEAQRSYQDAVDAIYEREAKNAADREAAVEAELARIAEANQASLEDHLRIIEEERLARLEANEAILRSTFEAAAAASSAWQQGIAAAWGNGEEVDARFMARLSAVTEAAQSAAMVVASALGAINRSWTEGLAQGVMSLMPLLTALGVQARTAAGIVGGIGLAASVVFGLMQQWQVAIPLAAASVSLLALAGKGNSKPAAETATTPSVASMAAAPRAAGSGGNLYVSMNFAGQPLHTKSDIQNGIMDILEAAQWGSRRIPAGMIG
jgi:hypothetical protein